MTRQELEAINQVLRSDIEKYKRELLDTKFELDAARRYTAGLEKTAICNTQLMANQTESLKLYQQTAAHRIKLLKIIRSAVKKEF